MKLVGAVIGLLIAFAIQKWAPTLGVALLSPTNLGTVLGAVGVLLTAPWAVALARQSVYEKLDDLTFTQAAFVVTRASTTRRFIVTSAIVNGVVAVVTMLLLAEIPKSPLVLFFAFPTLGIWIAGFFQGWSCWRAAEQSRISIAAAAATQRSRKAYVDRFREDDRKSPVNRKDEHLNQYAKVQD